LGGLLAHHLADPEIRSLFPESAARQIKGSQRYLVAREMFFSAELARILARLQAGNVPTMLLKGAALLQTVYTTAGMRPMSDIDLLVPADRAQEAQRMVMVPKPWRWACKIGL